MLRYLLVIPVLLSLLFINSESLAQYAGPGVKGTYSNVKEILDNPVDDAHFILQGRIINKRAHEKYTFADETGSITAEIDDEYFPVGVTIDDKTLVEIQGEVDAEFLGKKELEVKILRVVPPAK